MALRIDRLHLELLKAYGVEAYPNECCGFLLGRQIGGDKEVLSTFPVNNSREDNEKYHRYLISSDIYFEGQKFARERNMDIIGFYHSHPDAKALPSTYDLRHATWPWYSYVIISVVNNEAKEVTSWVLEDNRTKFKQEEICTVEYCEANG
ncbi:MAG: Mov34/MPN/PAD-1 family protein [bacterium]